MNTMFHSALKQNVSDQISVMSMFHHDMRCRNVSFKYNELWIQNTCIQTTDNICTTYFDMKFLFEQNLEFYPKTEFFQQSTV